MRTALVLDAGGDLRVFPVPTGGVRLGRGADADIRLEGDTVSRLHAAVHAEGDGFVIEHLSATNPTHVNDVAIERTVPLADGDQLRLGSAQLTFHDLASGDRLSGPMCSHCSRENRPDDHDCWYCGTSLLNAPTNVLAKREVSCRLVAAEGIAHDLMSGESFGVSASGTGSVHRQGEIVEGVASIARLEGEAAHTPDPSPDGLRLNDAVAAPGQPLASGDVLRWGESTFVVITRADS